MDTLALFYRLKTSAGIDHQDLYQKCLEIAAISGIWRSEAADV